jgi:hypothetical protein
MKVNYRIGNLELRLNDVPKEELKLHSPYSEIVQWSGNTEKHCCWTIATFEYDSDGYPELHYCGDRPLQLDKAQQEIFQILIKEGYSYKRNSDKEIIKIDFTNEYD